MKVYCKKLRYTLCCFETTNFPGGRGLMISWNPCENIFAGGFYHYPKAASHTEMFEKKREKVRLIAFNRSSNAISFTKKLFWTWIPHFTKSRTKIMLCHEEPSIRLYVRWKYAFQVLPNSTIFSAARYFSGLNSLIIKLVRKSRLFNESQLRRIFRPWNRDLLRCNSKYEVQDTGKYYFEKNLYFNICLITVWFNISCALMIFLEILKSKLIIS